VTHGQLFIGFVWETTTFGASMVDLGGYPVRLSSLSLGPVQETAQAGVVR
jgi:hypothetical protein